MPRSNGKDPVSDFDQHLAAYARARKQVKALAAANKPIPEHLGRYIAAVETEARNNFSPEELAALDGYVSRIEQRVYEQEQQLSREHAMAQALMNRELVSREATKGFLGEKNGVSHAQYTALEKGSKTLKLPTGRARINRDVLDERAKKFGPMLGVEEPTAAKFHAKLDSLLETKNANPDRYEEIVSELKLPRENLDRIVTHWASERVALGLAERYNAHDNEHKVPHEETVELSDADRRRFDLINHSTEATAKAMDDGDDAAGGWWSGDISQRTREDAARETLRLRREPNADGDELSTRDALIRAMDTHDVSNGIHESAYESVQEHLTTEAAHDG